MYYQILPCASASSFWTSFVTPLTNRVATNVHVIDHKHIAITPAKLTSRNCGANESQPSLFGNFRFFFFFRYNLRKRNTQAKANDNLPKHRYLYLWIATRHSTRISSQRQFPKRLLRNKLDTRRLDRQLARRNGFEIKSRSPIVHLVRVDARQVSSLVKYLYLSRSSEPKKQKQKKRRGRRMQINA